MRLRARASRRPPLRGGPLRRGELLLCGGALLRGEAWRARLTTAEQAHTSRPATVNIACAQVANELPAILDGEVKVPPRIAAHVERCLVCQAELARYRRLVRHLRHLRSAEIELPPGIVADVLAAIEQAASRSAVRSALSGRRAAYALALGLAASGTMASALLGASRARARSAAVLSVGSRSPAPQP